MNRRIIMQIAYLTLDEVNENLATFMVEESGATLFPLRPRDPKPDSEFDAVLYDLDSLPPPYKNELLSVLLSSPLLRPVGVHSYQLEDDEAAALRRCGLLVSRRIEPAVFQALCSQNGLVRKRWLHYDPSQGHIKQGTEKIGFARVFLRQFPS
jgi:hypothetical protein